MGEPVKLTNREVLESAAALAAFGQVKLPAKAAYAVAKAANKLGELEKAIRGVQKGLWEKYGEKDDKGNLKVTENNSFTVPAAQSAEFMKEHNELLGVPNDIDGLRPVTISELKDAEVEPAVLMHLSWFLKDE